MKKVSVIILTHQPEKYLTEMLKRLKNELSVEDEVIIMDSSAGGQYEPAEKMLIRTFKIKPEEFNHGSTRNLGANHAFGEILIYITQDAIIKEGAIKKLLEAYEDNKVAIAFGRQLPHENASAIAAHARLFNYPGFSVCKTKNDLQKYGIKTIFNSNSFSSYRTIFFKSLGGFPENTILSEDAYFAGKAILGGYKIAYVSEAEVFHSHNYSIWQEFKRYFDIGVFYHRESWLLAAFGKAEGEGKRFIISEWKYLIINGKWYLLPASFIRAVFKYLGYKLGSIESKLPVSVKRKLSMNSSYWKE